MRDVSEILSRNRFCGPRASDDTLVISKIKTSGKANTVQIAFRLGKGLMFERGWKTGDRMTLKFDITSKILFIKKIDKKDEADGINGWKLTPSTSTPKGKYKERMGYIVTSVFRITFNDDGLQRIGLNIGQGPHFVEPTKHANGISFPMLSEPKS